MREELKDLYLLAIESKDDNDIKAYHEAKNRIAPNIIIDEILECDELTDDLYEAQEAIKRLMDEYDILEEENKKLKETIKNTKEKPNG